MEDMALYKKSLVFGLSIILTSMSILATINISYKTVDDSLYLPALLEANRPQVLGANSNQENFLSGCSKEAPIAGWIDYRGKKTIPSTLPQGETASACFETIEAAQESGYAESE
jgi:hypothetical protein